MLSLFIIRYTVLAIIGAIIAGVVVYLYFLFKYFANPLFFVYIMEMYFPPVALIYVGVTFIFSIPALVRVYSLDLERTVRW